MSAIKSSKQNCKNRLPSIIAVQAAWSSATHLRFIPFQTGGAFLVLLFLMWMPPRGGAVLGVGKGLFDNILRFKQNLLGGKRRRQQPPFQQRAPRTNDMRSFFLRQAFSGRAIAAAPAATTTCPSARWTTWGSAATTITKRSVCLNLEGREHKISVGLLGSNGKVWNEGIRKGGNKVVGAFTFSKVQQARNLRVQLLPHCGLPFD